MDAVTTSKRCCPSRCLHHAQDVHVLKGACCRFGNGLGMHVVAKSDQSTGNTVFASYVLRSHDMVRLICCLHATPWHRQLVHLLLA